MLKSIVRITKLSGHTTFEQNINLKMKLSSGHAIALWDRHEKVDHLAYKNVEFGSEIKIFSEVNHDYTSLRENTRICDV